MGPDGRRLYHVDTLQRPVHAYDLDETGALENCRVFVRIELAALPVANCTKACFGGDDLRTLYVTTAGKGLSEQQRAQQPLAGGLFAARVDTPGLPQPRVRG